MGHLQNIYLLQFSLNESSKKFPVFKKVKYTRQWTIFFSFYNWKYQNSYSPSSVVFQHMYVAIESLQLSYILNNKVF